MFAGMWDVGLQNAIIDLLESFNNQNKISEKSYDDLYPSGLKPGILDGFGKIHKALEDVTQIFAIFWLKQARPLTS